MKLYVGDIGTEIVLDCGVDVSSATVRKILVRKPNSDAAIEWAALAEGTNKIKYVVVDGDLDVAGIYYLQAYIEMPTWKGRGETANLTVANLFG